MPSMGGAGTALIKGTRRGRRDSLGRGNNAPSHANLGYGTPSEEGGVALRRLSRERRGGASTGDTGE